MSALFVRTVMVGSTLMSASTIPRRTAATAVAAVPIPMYDAWSGGTPFFARRYWAKK